MAEIQNYKLYLDIISTWITILGVPIAIVLYYKEKKKERKEREYGTYNALDDKYIDFLNLCLTHSDLNISQIENASMRVLDEDQKVKQQMIFEVLTSILERAFLMYKDQGSEIKRNQWKGWELYINDWLSNNSDFRDFWGGMTNMWDANFIDYMNEIYKKHIS